MIASGRSESFASSQNRHFRSCADRDVRMSQRVKRSYHDGAIARSNSDFAQRATATASVLLGALTLVFTTPRLVDNLNSVYARRPICTAMRSNGPDSSIRRSAGLSTRDDHARLPAKKVHLYFSNELRPLIFNNKISRALSKFVKNRPNSNFTSADAEHNGIFSIIAS